MGKNLKKVIFSVLLLAAVIVVSPKDAKAADPSAGSRIVYGADAVCIFAESENLICTGDSLCIV